MQTFIQEDLGPQPLLAEISAREGAEFSTSTPAEISAHYTKWPGSSNLFAEISATVGSLQPGLGSQCLGAEISAGSNNAYILKFQHM